MEVCSEIRLEVADLWMQQGISVSQRRHTLDLLTKTNMLGCRPADTPIKLGNSDDQIPIDKDQYQRLVGKLNYLSHTHPVSSWLRVLQASLCKLLMKNTWKLSTEFWDTWNQHLVKGWIFRKTDRKTIEAHIDSDWARSVVDRKLTSGYCTFAWGNLVTWRSKKQSVVAKSSTEAKYRAMSLRMWGNLASESSVGSSLGMWDTIEAF